MKIICSVCQKSKPSLVCSACHSPVCKHCAQFIDVDSFTYAPERLAKIRSQYTDGVFCSVCFENHIAAEVNEYETTLAEAKKVSVFFKKHSKETRLIKRREEIVRVVDCPDYDEAILRLAFQAAKVKCNALIDVILDSKKMNVGTYTHAKWSGNGRPARVDEKVLTHDRMVIGNPN